MVNSNITRIDPSLLTTGTVTSGNMLGYSQKTLADTTASEFLEAFRNSELVKLEAMVEDARLLHVEEGDDASFGEYEGLRMALEWLKQSLEEAPSRIYNVRMPYANGGVLNAPGAWFIPNGGHTGTR